MPSDPVNSESPSRAALFRSTWTYTDCEGNTQDYVHTVTIELEPFATIAPTTDIVACVADIVLPTLPTVIDNCDNVLTPSEPVISESTECEGDIIYTWTYTYCEGNTKD